ncbi:galactoside O-acetyltransferase [Nitrosospira sp. Nsp18]|uniref:acyltransferase n=1 Tax=Nitrosospira sp. Nsp18 TaxID=1855334 RepID=UPI00087E32D1|nr:acyltransferase [Nitrosospira sp. Nsp18]SDA25541.1 galactoside O-acetyltransferase [Nitrosospira sp. Nsp18]
MSQQEKDRYYTRQELEGMRFRKLGHDVLISRTSRIYIPEYISIDNFSIVDDFCILSGNVEIGKNVHVAHGCRVIAGRDGIVMADFSGLAFGVTIFAQSDDYGGNALTNPTVPIEFRKILRARIEIGRHAIVGAGSVIVPGVILGEGSAIGSCSMVTKSTDPWTVYFGTPAKKIKNRSQNLLELEKRYLAERSSATESK